MKFPVVQTQSPTGRKIAISEIENIAIIVIVSHLCFSLYRLSFIYIFISSTISLKYIPEITLSIYAVVCVVIYVGERLGEMFVGVTREMQAIS